MWLRIALIASMAFIFDSGSAFASDVRHTFSIPKFLRPDAVQRKIPGAFRFYWGRQTHKSPIAEFGTVKASNRVRKGDRRMAVACSEALTKSIDDMRKDAVRHGANAIVGIVSTADRRPDSSQTAYTCTVGHVLVHVALEGTAVRLGK
jgi:uncharacterized protein YbjQ (UPF0145 family)